MKCIMWGSLLLSIGMSLFTLHAHPPHENDGAESDIITAMHQAAKEYDITKMTTHVSKGHSLNDAWLDGFLPIHTALLQMVIDNNEASRHHLSKRKLNFLRILVRLGADPLMFTKTRDFHHPLLVVPGNSKPRNRWYDINLATLCTRRCIPPNRNKSLATILTDQYELQGDVCDAIIFDRLHQQHDPADSEIEQDYTDAVSQVTNLPFYFIPVRTDAEHYSLLHLAVHYGATRSLQFLLTLPKQTRKLILQPDKKGRTPIDLAIEQLKGAIPDGYESREQYCSKIIDCVKLMLQHVSYRECNDFAFVENAQIQQESCTSHVLHNWYTILIEALNTTPHQENEFDLDSLNEETPEPPRRRRRVARQRNSIRSSPSINSWPTTFWPNTPFDDNEDDAPWDSNPWEAATFSEDSHIERQNDVTLHRGADTLTQRRGLHRDLRRLLATPPADEQQENSFDTPLWASDDVNRLDNE